MTHPLTDEICEELSCFHLSNWGDTGEGITQDMRAAADWQLGQVIEWIKEYPMRAGRARMIADFKQAMRPQEDN